MDEIAMGRPKKNQYDLRRKWPVLNVTPAERDAIQMNASGSGLGVSAYIIRCALERPPTPRQDWRRIVRQQAQLLQRLDDIAAELVKAESVRDAGRALLSLHWLEYEIGNSGAVPLAMPDGEDDGDLEC